MAASPARTTDKAQHRNVHDVGPLAIRFEASFDQTSYPTDSDPEARFLLEVELRRRDPESTTSIPVDIALVLDVSGSMRKEQRYDLLKVAVGEFINQLDNDDLFASRCFRPSPTCYWNLLPEARRSVDSLLKRMDQSPVVFGAKTNCAAGLQLIANLFQSAKTRGTVAQRIYIFTDGRFHDAAQCRQALSDVVKLRAEIGIYGFGTQLALPELQKLLAGQLGGWIKPIIDREAIVPVFAHIARVNRNLVAHQSRLVIEFDQAVTCGHAWSFRPCERHFGQITKRRNSCDLGAGSQSRVLTLIRSTITLDGRAIAP